jgi:hypothetical protein
MTSKWRDQRDIPSGRYGKIKTPGCYCDRMLTCAPCLNRAHTRNMAEIRNSPFASQTQEKG